MQKMNDGPENAHALPRERPWISLNTTYDVEAWIDTYNREMQASVSHADARGVGICFRLEAGGEIYLQTNGDGDIVLDLTPEAQWVAPLISAATGVSDPARRFWGVPGDRLTELVFGLNSLIAASSIVLGHSFRLRKF